VDALECLSRGVCEHRDAEPDYRSDLKTIARHTYCGRQREAEEELVCSAGEAYFDAMRSLRGTMNLRVELFLITEKFA